MKKVFSLFKDGTAKIGILDIKLKKHYLAFIMQAALGGLLIAGCIVLFDLMLGVRDSLIYFDISGSSGLKIDIKETSIRTFVIGSIAASTFLVFGAPRLGSSKPKTIFVGHLIAVIIGLIIINILDKTNESEGIFVASLIAVSLALFFMTALNFEHPPAAGTALAIATHNQQQDILIIALFVLVFAAALSVIRAYFYCDANQLSSIEGLGEEVQTALGKAEITSIPELCWDFKESNRVLLTILKKKDLYKKYCKESEIKTLIQGWIEQADGAYERKKKCYLIDLF